MIEEWGDFLVHAGRAGRAGTAISIVSPLDSKSSPSGPKWGFTNACVATAAFASQHYEKLRGTFTDHLHQPFRSRLIPFLPRVIAAAEDAGALGAFLSGSGSAIGHVVGLNFRHGVEQLGAEMRQRDWADTPLGDARRVVRFEYDGAITVLAASERRPT